MLHLLCWIPTCLFLESHWESLTKTAWSECESVPLALSPGSRADHLTTSSRLGHEGPSDQTWETCVAAIAKLLHSPSSFRLLCPPQLPQPALPLASLTPAGASSSAQRDPSGAHWKKRERNPSSQPRFCVCEWDRDVKEHWWQNGTRKQRCQRRFAPRRANFILLSRWPWAGYHGNIPTLTLKGVLVALCSCGDKALSPQNREKWPKAKGWK